MKWLFLVFSILIVYSNSVESVDWGAVSVAQTVEVETHQENNEDSNENCEDVDIDIEPEVFLHTSHLNCLADRVASLGSRSSRLVSNPQEALFRPPQV